jgi:hypothetical protein
VSSSGPLPRRKAFQAEGDLLLFPKRNRFAKRNAGFGEVTVLQNIDRRTYLAGQAINGLLNSIDGETSIMIVRRTARGKKLEEMYIELAYGIADKMLEYDDQTSGSEGS